MLYSPIHVIRNQSQADFLTKEHMECVFSLAMHPDIMYISDLTFLYH